MGGVRDAEIVNLKLSSDPYIDPNLRRKCYGWSAGCGNCMSTLKICVLLVS